MSQSSQSFLSTIENAVTGTTLIAMIALPLLEVVLRRLFGFGIQGASGIVQHLCLIVGMFGAVLAARQHRLLTLSALAESLKNKLRVVTETFAGGVSVAAAVLLGIGGAQFVQSDYGADKYISYNVPVWAIQLVIPAGFMLIAVHLLLNSAKGWKVRLSVGGVALALIAVWYLVPEPSALVPGALIILAAATLAGVPVFVSLGGLALILFWGMGEPISTIAIDHYSLVTDPSLPTIPLFTLAGYALAESGAPRRLVRVFRAVLGNFAGSSVIATVLLCAFFTTFTGASGITILAIGGLLMPVLQSDGLREGKALGLVTSAGSLGLLFPPCLPLILYAVVSKVPLEAMFLGGLLPEVLMVVATALWGLKGRSGEKNVGASFSWEEATSAFWDAKWELMLPVVALASLFSGLATTVEAAALTALYAFVVETLIHRDLTFTKDVPRVLVECGLLVGGVLVILGVAQGFTSYIVDVNFTARAVDWITATIQSPLVFLLVLNLWLLVVGCLMDIYSAIVIQVPLLVPIAFVYHIDPIHLGIIFLANLEVGYLTPPVGLNLFMSSSRFKKSLPEVTRATLPVAAVLFAAVLLITYFPLLTTFLPYHFHAN